jgi:GNAT superfamily N-acetyltransferase
MPEIPITVRQVRDEDYPQLLELLQRAFGGWPKLAIQATPIEHLRWKWEAWPGYAHRWVAELDGKIVACQIDHVRVARARGLDLRVSRGADAAVDPTYQSRGVMRVMRPVMTKADAAASELFIGVAVHPALTRLYEKEPRRIFGQRWTAFIRPLSPRAALRVLKVRVNRAPRKLLSSLAMFARWFAIERTSRSKGTVSIRAATEFDDRANDLFEQVASSFDFIFVRDRVLLNWRYADRRAGDFTIRLAEEGDRLIGYTVLRSMNGTGYIADILALPARNDAVDALLDDAVEQLRQASVRTVECWLFGNHPYVPALQRAGFLGRRKKAQPTYEAVGIPEEQVSFLGDSGSVVHFTVGEMDYV